MNNKSAFTLAEVLTTLGIIGIVAAITIPTLVSNGNAIKFSSQYKKTMSVLNQAVNLSSAKYDKDFKDIKAKCSNNPTADSIETGYTICGLLNNNLLSAKYIENPFSENIKPNTKYSISGTNKVDANTTGWHGYLLVDGSLFIFKEEDKSCTAEDKCMGYIDVNGFTPPNKEANGVAVAADIFTPAAYAKPSGGNVPEPSPYASQGGGNNSGGNEDPGSGSSSNGNNAVTSGFTDDDTITTVPQDKSNMTDVYPVYFYNSKVEPATKAASLVLINSNK